MNKATFKAYAHSLRVNGQGYTLRNAADVDQQALAVFIRVKYAHASADLLAMRQRWFNNGRPSDTPDAIIRLTSPIHVYARMVANRNLPK